jgi:hypothetical protein
MKHRILVEKTLVIISSLAVDAANPSEAFQKTRDGQAVQIAERKEVGYLIRDYPLDQSLHGND